jgi:hypothetical protein
MTSARYTLCLTLLTVVAGCQKPQLSAPPTPAATRDGRWKQDITYVCDNVARLHKDAFRFASRQEYEAARDDLLAKVPELSDAAIIVRLAAIIAQLNDAHTRHWIGGPLFPKLPFQVGRPSDGFFLIAVPMEHKDLLEGKIVMVGDTPIDEAVRRMGTVVSHENDIRVRLHVPHFLRMPAVLHELRLSSRNDAVSLGVETKDGIRTVEFEFTPEGETPALAQIERQAVPLASQRKNEHYWYQTIPQHQTVYLAYNACYEDKNRPFRDFAAEILKELENPDIKRLIIDLRRNGGGSQLVAWPLFKKLQGHRLDEPGGIIVLIGAGTFSSATGNTLELRDWTQAVLIGERTGQCPNSFGEIKTFQSPNHKLTVTYSTKYFVRGAEDDDTVVPDVEVRFTFEDWKQGKDPMLEAALAYHP